MKFIIKQSLLNLHENGFWLQDLLSVLTNIRPICRFAIDKKRYLLLKKSLPILKLYGLLYTYEKFNNTPICVIGKNKDHIKKIAHADTNEPQDEGKIGQLLGYPKCCIEFYKNTNRNREERIMKQLSIEKNCHELNYFYNLDSRIKNNDYHKLVSIKKYSKNRYYFIPHIPCSFNCKASLNYVNNLKIIMKKEFANITSTIEIELTKIMLYINVLKFANFTGILIKPNHLIYDKVFYLNNLFGIKLFNKLLKGNNLILRNDTIFIFKNSILIHKQALQAKIINFD